MTDNINNTNMSDDEELSQIKVDFPQVYDYLVAHLDERSSSVDGWHAKFAKDVVQHFDLSGDLYWRLWPAIHALAIEKYGTKYPGRDEA